MNWLIKTFGKESFEARKEIEKRKKFIGDSLKKLEKEKKIDFMEMEFLDSEGIEILDIFDFERVIFEVISAIGTVGLSCGITPYLKSSSKVVIVVLMFIGRVGPLTFFTALNLSKKNEKVTYPETEIMIG